MENKTTKTSFWQSDHILTTLADRSIIKKNIPVYEYKGRKYSRIRLYEEEEKGSLHYDLNDFAK